MQETDARQFLLDASLYLVSRGGGILPNLFRLVNDPAQRVIKQ